MVIYEKKRLLFKDEMPSKYQVYGDLTLCLDINCLLCCNSALLNTQLNQLSFANYLQCVQHRRMNHEFKAGGFTVKCQEKECFFTASFPVTHKVDVIVKGCSFVCDRTQTMPPCGTICISVWLLCFIVLIKPFHQWNSWSS